MDKDVDVRLIPKGVYRTGTNIRIASSDGEDAGAVRKVKGTLEWEEFTDGAGEAAFTCLGARVYKDHIYAFYYGTTSTDTYLYEISRLTQTSTLLLQEDLGNSASDIINDIEIVENNDSDRYIYWNDKVTAPKKANITQLTASATYYAIADLDLIKAPPEEGPAIINPVTTGDYEIKYKDQIQVAYQYIYEDGEESAVSFYSETVFDNEDTAPDIEYNNVLTLDFAAAQNIYYSTNFGTAFTNVTPDSSGSYDNFVMDYYINLSGSKMWLISVDAGLDGQLFKSVDSGATWDQYYAGIAIKWKRVVCDSEGLNVYAVYESPTHIVLTKAIDGTSGPTEIHSVAIAGTPPHEVACNAAGDVVYFIGANDEIEVSRDSGSTFTTHSLPATFALTDITRKLKCNSAGNIVYIFDVSTDILWRSSDYGQTWVDVSDATGVSTDYDIDASGTIVYTINDQAGQETIRRSTNAGLTWSSFGSVPATGVASDASIAITQDGEQGLVATLSGGVVTGYHFTSAAVITARTINGLHIQLQEKLVEEERSLFYLRNDISGFDMRVQTGSKHVDKIRLLYRYANETTWRVLDELNKALLSIADNATYDYTFDKSAFNRVLSPEISDKLYDNVPHKANSMTLMNNRLIFGGYTDGYSLGITPDFDVTQNLPAGATGLSLKAGTTQKYGIVYYDEYNRSSAPLIDPDGSLVTFSRVFDEATPLRAATVTIGHLPPSWAVKFKIVRARPIIDYRFITNLTDFKLVNGRIYFYIGATQGQYAINDSIEAISLKSGTLITDDLFVPIEDLIFKDDTFADSVDAGYWAVVTPPTTGPYSATSLDDGSSLWPFTVFYLIKYDLDNPESIYLETNETFDVTGGFHIGNTQAQTGGQDAIIDLTDGDVWWSQEPFYIEKFQIDDSVLYNALGRGILASENFKQIARYASMCFSDLFVPDTGFNGLSSFNLGLPNFKDLNIGDGEITLLEPDYTDILVLQEDLISKVLVDKDVLQTASGDGLLSGSTRILGQQIPYAGDYGCQDPAAFARWGNVKYIPDRKRGVVLRLSQDGLTEISRYGFRDYFNDLFRTSTVLRGSYDPRHSEYILYDVTNAVTIGFSEPKNGFPSFFEYSPDFIINDGYQLWGFKDEFIWKHNATETYNNFYGVQKTSKIAFVFNDAADVIKIIESISLHGDSAWVVNYIKERFRETDIPSANFENKEGYFFAFIPKAVGTTRADIITDNVSTQGLGEVISVTSTTIVTLPKASAAQASVGDIFYAVGPGGAVSGGPIVAITQNAASTTIEYTTPTAFLMTDKFCFAQKNSYLEGDSLRDYYFELELEHLGSSDTELFSVVAEVKQSKQ